MLSRLKSAGLLWPAVLTAAGLAILLSLGSWQLSRRQWKDGLLSQIEARAKAAPIDMAAAVALWNREKSAAEHTPVRVRGAFVERIERNYFVGDQKLGPGAQVYSPLAYAPGMVVWVDRGFRPDRAKGGEGAAAGGEVEVVGVIRGPGAQGAFAPANDVARNVWYWRDLAGMHASAFASGNSAAAPFFIEARQISGGVKAEWPKPGASPVRIENRHLEYALTWFGLAATLAGVFLAYARGRLKREG